MPNKSVWTDSDGLSLCPACDHTFSGRSNQRHCSQRCRRDWNKRKKIIERHLELINSELRANRLKEFHPDGREYV